MKKKKRIIVFISSSLIFIFSLSLILLIPGNNEDSDETTKNASIEKVDNLGEKEYDNQIEKDSITIENNRDKEGTESEEIESEAGTKEVGTETVEAKKPTTINKAENNKETLNQKSSKPSPNTSSGKKDSNSNPSGTIKPSNPASNPQPKPEDKPKQNSTQEQKPESKPKPDPKPEQKPDPKPEPAPKYLSASEAQKILESSGMFRKVGNKYIYAWDDLGYLILEIRMGDNHVKYVYYDSTLYTSYKGDSLERLIEDNGEEQGRIEYEFQQQWLRNIESAVRVAANAVYGVGTTQANAFYSEMINFVGGKTWEF